MKKDPHPYVSCTVINVLEELHKVANETSSSTSSLPTISISPKEKISSKKESTEKGKKEDSWLKNFLSPKKERKTEIDIFETSGTDLNRLIEETQKEKFIETTHLQEEFSFYNWCSQKFSSPCLSYDGLHLMEEKEMQTLHEQEYFNYCKLRYKKSFINVSTLTKTKKYVLEHQNAITHSSTLATNLLFHPCEPLLLFSGPKTNSIVVWKWKNEPIKEINNFSSVSSMCFLEPLYSSTLVVGGTDGCIRVFNNISSIEKEKMASSWRASISPVILTNFHQDSHLVSGGNLPFVRIWDIEREYSIEDIKTGTNIAVTSLATGKTEGNCNLFVTGFANGVIRVFDKRVSEKDSTVISFTPRLKSWPEHSQSIISLSIPDHQNTIVSGSSDGFVKFWDLRNTTTESSFNSFDTRTNAMSSFAVHNYAPLFACGFRSQKIEVFNFDGQSQSLIKYRVGFLEERIGPISAVNFHPTKTLLAASSFDGFVSVYSNKEKKL